MTTTIHRTFKRTTHQVPIQYALLDSDQFHPAHTYNFSPDGLCYEIQQPLNPGTDVCILMDNYTPGRPGPEGYRSYVASIRWTQSLPQTGFNRYAVGARFIARSHGIITAEKQLPHCHCDLCGESKPLNKFEETFQGAQLCTLCMKHFKSISSPRIRKCLERFLIGNVL
jgi:hypothetical protein